VWPECRWCTFENPLYRGSTEKETNSHCSDGRLKDLVKSSICLLQVMSRSPWSISPKASNILCFDRKAMEPSYTKVLGRASDPSVMITIVKATRSAMEQCRQLEDSKGGGDDGSLEAHNNWKMRNASRAADGGGRYHHVLYWRPRIVWWSCKLPTAELADSHLPVYKYCTSAAVAA